MTLTLKIKRLLIRASSVTAVICTVSLTIQLYLSRWYRSVEPVKIAGSVEDDASTQTVWDVMKQDLNISHFAKLTEDIPGVVDGLTSLKGQFTVYAPTNEAFEREQLAYDTPSFGWMMLVGYHMGFGAWSPEALREKTTVPSFLHADRFFKYKQRIRTQPGPDRLTLNFRGDVIGPPTKAANGYLYHIDRVLTLPEAVAIILRDTPEFSTFRKGLIQSQVAVAINDTSHHDGQTVFVPTNTAFEKLGPQVNRFLFGPEGRAYLQALLQYHIVHNQTMYSNVYYQAHGAGEITLTSGVTMTLPTLAHEHALTITTDSSEQRLSIAVNEVPVSTPDIVAMDGVVHAIDTVLLPPTHPFEQSTDTEARWWLGSVFQNKFGRPKMTIPRLKVRLDPLLHDVEDQ